MSLTNALQFILQGQDILPWNANHVASWHSGVLPREPNARSRHAPPAHANATHASAHGTLPCTPCPSPSSLLWPHGLLGYKNWDKQGRQRTLCLVSTLLSRMNEWTFSFIPSLDTWSSFCPIPGWTRHRYLWRLAFTLDADWTRRLSECIWVWRYTPDDLFPVLSCTVEPNIPTVSFVLIYPTYSS